MGKLMVVYTGEETPEEVTSSIFLAGPTPRDSITPSWRVPDAIKILERIGYDGIVYVPEFRDRDRVVTDAEYEDQVYWEDNKLNMSDCIAFQVDRNLDTMPAFTTNHEHGEWFKSGKIVFGALSTAPKNRYLQLKGREYKVAQAETLEETLRLAVAMVGEGALRKAGERYVPLQIWNTASFKSWYADLKTAGNRLDFAKVLWTHRFAPDYDEIFYWSMLVDIYITKEDRHKSNEPVISRPDTSTVVLFKRTRDPEIVLVREFRSPVSNSKGFVWEPVSGSSFHHGDPRTRALEEVREETGLVVTDPNRLLYHGARQLAATMSTHKSYLFSMELTDSEYQQLKSQAGVVFGDEVATERTYVEFRTLQQLMEGDYVDWSTVGMVAQVLSV